MPIRPATSRKTVNQVATAGNNTGISVRISAIQRELDTYVQRQLRVENSGASYADTRAQMYQQLQDIYGQPGSANTLETVYNNFTNALQALSTSPDDPAARSSVISTAQLLTQQLNQTSDSIQGLARRRRARHFRRGDQGQRGDEPDRHAQSADRRIQPERQRDRHADGPARRLYRSVVAVDGHQRRQDRQQSGLGLHQFRRPARRHASRADCASTRRAP